MIRAIFQTHDNRIVGFVVTGHAGATNGSRLSSLLSRKKGKQQKHSREVYDLVCAAVSAICFSALGGLDELCGISGHDEEDGDLRFSLPKQGVETNLQRAQIILSTMEIGLKQVELDYREHITVTRTEVSSW